MLASAGMPAVLVAHRNEAALERERIAGLVALLRRNGLAVEHTTGASWLAVERAADAADHVLLVDPDQWWSSEPSPGSWDWLLCERLELYLANQLPGIAVVLHGQRALPDSLLDAVPRFVLPGAWADLLDHLATPKPERARLHVPLPEPRPLLPRPKLERALAQAVERSPGQLVWIRGSIGAGKSTLLRSYLDRADEPATLVHVARPEIAATLRPSEVLELLGEQPAEPSLLVIDGLEQLLDRTDALVPADERRRLAQALTGPLPAQLTVIATSRPMAAGLLGTREPAIDLDAPQWAAEQCALVEALLGERLDMLGDLAGQNPGAARALLDLGDATLGLDEVPPRFAVPLERAFVRLLQLPIELRRPIMAGLGVLRVARAPVPERLLVEALGVEPLRALEHYAAQWLRHEDGLLALVHPFAAGYLAAELDPGDLGPHFDLLAGLERLRRRGPLAPAVECYASQWELHHRQARRGLGVQELWLRSVPVLQHAAGEGTLEGKLEQALADARPEHVQLTEAMHAIVRRHSLELARDPSGLPKLLWTELVARGFSPDVLDFEFAWSDLRPPIRLQNRLNNLDCCYRILSGLASPVFACALSRDGALAVTLQNHSQLRIWDLRAGSSRELRLGTWSQACALTPDGTRLVASESNNVILLDPHTDEQLAKHKQHGTSVTALAISDDGTRVLSGDRNGAVKLWDVGTNRVIELGRHGDEVTQCVVSTDGALAASGGRDNIVRVWSLSDASLHAQLRGHSYGIGGLALTRDGKRLISICIGEARVWDPANGQQLACHKKLGESCVGAVVVANDSEVLVAGASKRVTRWKLADATITARHLAHPLLVRCIAASEDGEWYLTGGDDQTARLWRRADIPEQQAGIVAAIDVLLPGEEPNTVWVAGGSEGIRLIELGVQRPRVKLQGHGSASSLACFRGRIYAGGSNKRVTVYSSDSGAERSHWQPGNGWIRAVVIDGERERVVFAGADERIFVAPLEGGKARSVAEHNGWITALALLPDGRVLAADNDGRIRLWDLDAEQLVGEHTIGAKHAFHTLEFDSSGSSVAVTGERGAIDILSLRDGGFELVRSLRGHVGRVNSLALRSDDRVLVSAGYDRTLRLWSVADGRQLASVTASYPLTQVVFVGERLVVGDVSGNVMIFEVDWSTIIR